MKNVFANRSSVVFVFVFVLLALYGIPVQSGTVHLQPAPRVHPGLGQIRAVSRHLGEVVQHREDCFLRVHAQGIRSRYFLPASKERVLS